LSQFVKHSTNAQQASFINNCYITLHHANDETASLTNACNIRRVW